MSFPGTPLPKAEYVGLPIRRMISQLDRAALRAEAREFFGLDPDLPTLVVTGGSQGARRLNESVSGRRPGARRRRRAGAARGRASTASRDAGTDRDAVRRRRLRRPDGLRARRRRPDGLPGRRLQRHRGGRGRACRRSSCRCRSATASRSTTPARSSTPGERCWSPTRRSPPEWVAATVPALATDAERLAAMGAAAAALIPRDADEKLARIVLEGRPGAA